MSPEDAGGVPGAAAPSVVAAAAAALLGGVTTPVELGGVTAVEALGLGVVGVAGALGLEMREDDDEVLDIAVGARRPEES